MKKGLRHSLAQALQYYNQYVKDENISACNFVSRIISPVA